MAGLHGYYSSILGVPLAQLRYLDADLAFPKLTDTARLYEMAFGDAGDRPYAPARDCERASGSAPVTMSGASPNRLRDNPSIQSLSTTPCESVSASWPKNRFSAASRPFWLPTWSVTAASWAGMKPAPSPP